MTKMTQEIHRAFVYEIKYYQGMIDKVHGGGSTIKEICIELMTERGDDNIYVNMGHDGNQLNVFSGSCSHMNKIDKIESCEITPQQVACFEKILWHNERKKVLGKEALAILPDALSKK